MDVIEKLRKERQQLQKRLNDIDALLEQFEGLKRLADQLVSSSSLEDEVPGRAIHKRSTPSRERQARKRPEVAAFEEAALAVLAEAEGPLDRQEVLKRVEERGIVVGGDDPANVVGARLFRMEGVRGQRSIGFWLETRTAELGLQQTVGSDSPT